MDQSTTRLIEAARDVLRASGYFVDNLWHIKDVHFICEQKELPKVSDDEAMEVFVLANKRFDGETGISWPQLEHALRNFLHCKMILNDEWECESSPVA